MYLRNVTVGFVALIIDVSSHASLRSGGASVAHVNDDISRRLKQLQLIELKTELHVPDEVLPIALRSTDTFQAVAVGVVVHRAVITTECVDHNDLDRVTVKTSSALRVDRADGPVGELVLVSPVPHVIPATALRHAVGTSLKLSEEFADLGLNEIESAAKATLDRDHFLVLGVINHAISLQADDAHPWCCQLIHPYESAR